MKRARITAAVILLAVADNAAATSSVEADLNSIRAAVDVYRSQTGSLPPCDIGLNSLVNRPDGLQVNGFWAPIMTKIPMDPWGRPYILVIDAGQPEGFGIYCKGPDGVSRTVGNDPDDYNTWSPSRRGIETDILKRMPWLWPSIALACVCSFYLGVRTERYWTKAEAVSPSRSLQPALNPISSVRRSED